MAQIPPEIWLYIIHFLPKRDVWRLVGLNRTFFHLAMNERYKEVTLASLNNSAVRKLISLKDPNVAIRVRDLHVGPAFIGEVLAEENAAERFLGWRPHAIANRVLHPKAIKQHRHKESQTILSSDKIVELVSVVFSHCSSVVNCHILWYDRPVIPQTTIPFLAAPTMPNIRKLLLEVSLKTSKQLFQSSATFDVLEELDITFRNNGNPLLDKANMVEHVAPFICRLRALRSLIVVSKDNVDFSPLFLSLYLPSLQKATISIPMGHAPLSGHSSIGVFLNRHSGGLQYIALQAAYPFGSWEWVERALPDTGSPSLRTLLLDLKHLPINLNKTMACIQRLADTLTSLVLVNRYLTYEEVDMAINAFAHRPADATLERLGIYILTLTPQIVDLLANRLSGLRWLGLRIKSIVPYEGDLPRYIYGSDSQQDDLQVEMFCTEMRKHMYADWMLQRIDIRMADPTYNFRARWYMPLFSKCIPSIKTHGGLDELFNIF